MNRNIRDYEVSVWTLQDSFITVLKHSGTDNKGRIEEPDFDLKNDGTLTFKFSIPMYLKENNVKIENPIWYNTTNGNIIADLRKIKVIFHKNTEYEHIFELLITKVTESHEGFQLTCDVECESLAFHELGKSGYKLSLNQDTFIDYWTKWANGEITGNEPKSNIKFWSDRVIEGTDWECEVQMDWSGYDTSRASNIIYEDAYAAAWDVSNEDKFIPTTVVQSKEKERLIDVEESNRYNITQTIAETFGVHCRYEYEHDSDYHITARKIIFYNAFVQEALGPIDINYAYDTTDISREMDSKDTITKMYVKTLTDSNTESGLATIADTAANKSQEDYLLNFDYLYSIGTISQEQYDAIESYEIKMHQLNEELKGYERQISALENQKIDAAAAEAVAKNAVSLDNERISANNDLLNAITNNTGVVHVTATRPDTCAIIRNNNNSYITLRQKGIVSTTIHIYENFTPGATNALSNEIISYTLNYDEFGNLTKISNITFSSENTQIVYLIYDYEPRLYYENILKTWETRLARDKNEQQFQEQVLENLDAELTNLNAINESKLNEKKDAIKHFERLMGPAIREGYWQPEDEYAKYGERYEENLILSNSSKLDDNLFSIGWDNILFDEEDTNYYEIELTQSQEYYPCIRLSNLNIFNSLNYDLNQISFIYQDAAAPASTSTDDIRYLRFLPIGSQCQLRFIHLKNSSLSAVEPVLMLTGLKNVSYNIFDITNYPNTHPRIGVLTTNTSSGSISSNITTLIDETTIRSNLISGIENYEMVYPRIQINSANLKVSEDSLVLKYGNIVLNNYEDYYILGRTDSITNIFKYYITIKPEQLFQKTGYGSYKLLCELSNAGLFMYLDAVQVMKENAYPRVSYEIKPTFVNDEFIRYAYKYLNYIVHINDPELKFEYVKGYITELHLKLDSPKDDTITIDNYKTKFEDLFSTIVVQTEEMKKNSTLIGMAVQAFTPTGGLQADLVQTVMDRVDLNYAFNNGTLTINEEDGIWGTSDSGVVAFRGGGIFTATEKDDNDEWIWNTGILPSGINASLITTGQLDTNLIRIFAGDDLKLQMNGDGLFAYRSQWSNNNHTKAIDETRQDGLDLGQYVVHNGDGLFLIAKQGTKITNESGNILKTLNQDVERVAISWDGLKLRNWDNQDTLYADPDTGNLILKGTVYAQGLYISTDPNIPATSNDTIENYVSNIVDNKTSTIIDTIENLQNQVDGEVDTWFFVGAPHPLENDQSTRVSEILETEWNIVWNENTGYSIEDIAIIKNHISDIYYDIGKTPENIDNLQEGESLTAGLAYRFIIENNKYYWLPIADTAALSLASRAQETADGKIKTYYAAEKANVIPLMPNINSQIFGEGDLWINTSKSNALYRYNGTIWEIAGDSIDTVDVEYAVNNNLNPPSDNSEYWVSTMPSTLVDGSFLWTRTVTVKNGTKLFTTPICINVPNIPMIHIDGEHIITNVNGNNTPSSIKLTATTKNISVGSWWYAKRSIDENYNEERVWTKIESLSSLSECVISTADSANYWADNNKNVIIIRAVADCYTDEQIENMTTIYDYEHLVDGGIIYYDEFIIIKLEDEKWNSYVNATTIYVPTINHYIIDNFNYELDGYCYNSVNLSDPTNSITGWHIGFRGIDNTGNFNIRSTHKDGHAHVIVTSALSNAKLEDDSGFFYVGSWQNENEDFYPIIIWKRLELGNNADNFSITATKTSFSKNDIDPIVLQGILYRNGMKINNSLDIVYQWSSIPFDSTLENENTNTINISRSDINGAKTYTCICSYNGQSYTDSITIQDKVDPVVCVIYSTGGDKFIDGIQDIYLICKTYENGEETDLNGTRYKYVWSINNETITSNSTILINTLPENFENDQYSIGYNKIIKLTSNDINRKAIIDCSIQTIESEEEEEEEEL